MEKFRVFVWVHNALNNYWVLGNLATALPPGIYYLENTADDSAQQQAAIAWGLGAYQFTRYKPANKTIAKFMLADNANLEFIEHMVQTTYWIRDLINTPTEDMGPVN